MPQLETFWNTIRAPEISSLQGTDYFSFKELFSTQADFDPQDKKAGEMFDVMAGGGEC